MKSSDVLVIGGGAAGMMAALSAREHGASVILLEPNQKLGRKLYITGKGRCNLTNDCDVATVLQNIPNNGRFLHSAVNHFPPALVKAWFERLGVPLKTERGGRVFPCSDKAADVIDALFFSLRRKGIKIVHERAEKIWVKNGKVQGVSTGKQQIPCDTAIIATGGASYSMTGSTGDGYRMAKELGHSIRPISGSLVPLEEDGEYARRMQGLSLRNVMMTVKNKKKKLVYQEQGKMLFTHFGLSGPLVLSASAHMRNFNTDQYTAEIDLKPALEEEKLEERLLRELAAQPNRSIQNVMEGLLPRLMIPVMLGRSGIPKDQKANLVTKAQRRELLHLLKHFQLDILRPRPVEEAIVTAGGVETKEIDPSSMMSKLVKGLFFAGEVIDVDAYTGGFNLQIAWCTGRVAGESAAGYQREGSLDADI